MAHVLDTTAVVAVLLGETEGLAVTRLLERARRQRTAIMLPFITLLESRYKLLRDYGTDAALASMRLVNAWPASVVESSPAWGVRAAEVKARGGLSLADAWIAALALMHDAELVHKDPEFERVDGLRHYALN